ncbi:MAG: hypothetical protein HFG53_08185 [Lachnospiraceae bacterium]|jgi:hypothetical protein|nr:hypothetical protein [Lachnospiraceae bacterium]
MSLVMLLLLMTISPVALISSLFGINYNYSKIKYYLPLLVVALSLIAYQYVPMQSNDLLKYYHTIEIVGEMNLLEAIDYLEDGLLIKNFLFWILGKTGMPQMLPMITAAIVYGVMFYISYDCAKEYCCQQDLFKILIIQFFSISFFGQLGTVRSCIAYAIVILAVYLDLYKRKRNLITYVIYIIPCFIHITALLLIGIRLLFYISNHIRKIAIIGIMSLSTIELISRSDFSRIFGGYGQLFFAKWDYYVHKGGTSAWDIYIDHNLGFQVYKYIMLFLILILLYMYFYIKRRYKRMYLKSGHVYDYNTFEFCLCVVACLTIIFMHGNNCERFISAAIIGSGSILAPIFGKHNFFYKNKNLSVVKLCMVFALIPIVVYHVHIDKWSVDWKNISLSFLNNNIYLLLFRLLENLLRI